ncbi:MAG TPA: metal ABC transporter substrate-binding protein [Pilimelia sp.]|nr:metal ABC transporter substrate-binding protein [Pilimelia sp.]
MPRRSPLAALLTAAVLLPAAAACGSGSAAGNAADGPAVVAAFYPLEFVAGRVGGTAVTVTGLAKPGAEPHDLELNPGQIAQLSDADLVVYLKGFQPAVDGAVAQAAGAAALDVAATVPLLDAAAGGHEHEGGDVADNGGGPDPHLWLDPTRLATVGDALAARLATADAEAADGFRSRAAALRSDLTALDKEYADGLRDCQRREMIVSHAAFGYLAERYNLEQIAVTGLSPEQEPSPQRLAAVIEEAREHKATTIFFETLVSPEVAETIAQEVGARTAVLDPLEGLEPGTDDDYLAVMRKNLATLRTALGCR